MDSRLVAVPSLPTRPVPVATAWAVSLRVALALAAGLFILIPLLTHDGWPYNHDEERPLTRMAIVASHWRMGQLIPVWSTSAVMGYGSPSPILYNKSFTYLSALFYLLIGDGKTALCVSLLIFLMVGFLGAAACVRAVCGRTDLPLEAFAGFMLVSCNYTTADWLVRGADAEFAAMMLAPSLFLWCFRLLGEGTWRLWLGALLAAMALTHSTIALFCLVPIGLSLALAIVRWRRRAFAWWRPAVLSGLICAAIVLPFALPMAALMDYGRVDFFLAFSPRSKHASPLRFLWDDQWSWGGTEWLGLSLQIDTGLLLAFAAMLAMLVWRRGKDPERDASIVWFASLLALVTLVMMALQMRSALVIFEWVPGARYIQFTWRLLLFVTISLVLCAAILLHLLRLARYPRLAVALGVALMVSTLVNKPWWSGMPRPWYSPAEVASATHWAHDFDPPEYFPRFTGVALEPWPGWTPAAQGLRNLPERFPYTCRVTPLDNLDWERATARISVSCPTSGVAALPAFLVRGLRVEADGVPVAVHRTCRDPRALAALPAGTTVLTLRFPTWRSVMAAFLTGPGPFDISRCGPGDA